MKWRSPYSRKEIDQGITVRKARAEAKAFAFPRRSCSGISATSKVVRRYPKECSAKYPTSGAPKIAAPLPSTATVCRRKYDKEQLPPGSTKSRESSPRNTEAHAGRKQQNTLTLHSQTTSIPLQKQLICSICSRLQGKGRHYPTQINCKC